MGANHLEAASAKVLAAGKGAGLRARMRALEGEPASAAKSLAAAPEGEVTVQMTLSCWLQSSTKLILHAGHVMLM